MVRGNIARLRSLMARESLDAIQAFTPGNIQYLVGYQPPALIVRVIGAYSAILATSDDIEPGLVVGEFDQMWARQMSRLEDVKAVQLWVEIEDRDDLLNHRTSVRPKREQFDWDQVFSLLRDAYGERRLLGGRVGCEWESLPNYFRERLLREFPEIDWVDASSIFAEAAEIKTEEEIAVLRKSVELSEIGMSASILDSDPRGKTVSQIRNDFDMAVRSAVSGHPTLHGFQGCRVFMTSGGTIGPNTARDDTVVAEGDVIWMDCGVTVDGYQADIGRTVAVGTVDPLTRRIADALAAGGSAGYERLAVGAVMNEVFAATQDAVRNNGLGTYTRGHVGHAIGTGGGEHHPFISPQEVKTFEPGMVFAFERPFYLRGHGGFQFEDNLVVHQERIEVLNQLPQGLLISG